LTQPIDQPVRRPPASKRLAETAPLILETGPVSNYALLDSGNERKIERYGPLIIERPEGQAIWRPHLPEKRWRDGSSM
jgi:23S rRNA (cytosine1962-C5)-methyltransferase